MAAPREELEGLLVGQLFDSMQKGPGEDYWAAAAEVERRKFAAQTAVNEAQIEAAKSTTEAAEAAKTTAEYTRRNARYMLLSVIAIFLTAGASAVFQLVTLILAWVQASRPS